MTIAVGIINKIFNNIHFLNHKTIYLNFKYLPIRQAVHLPFFVSYKVRLRKVKGKVIIACSLKPGLIKLGVFEIGLYDKKHNRVVWENEGVITFKGPALFKYGSILIVGPFGRLELGNNFRFSSGSVIICYKNIIIGDNCRVSWDTQIIDSDFHRILDKDGVQINPDKEIIIGDNCWIGNRTTINKGAFLGSDTVVASNSLVNKKFEFSNVIIAGIPAKIIRSGISWSE